jgi:hypothetical protein
MAETKWGTTKSGARYVIERERDGELWGVDELGALTVRVTHRSGPPLWYAVRDDGLVITRAQKLTDVTDFIKKFGDVIERGPRVIPSRESGE